MVSTGSVWHTISVIKAASTPILHYSWPRFSSRPIDQWYVMDGEELPDSHNTIDSLGDSKISLPVKEDITSAPCLSSR